MKIVCWKWRGHEQYRSKFTAEHVNTLRAMVARHYKTPHEFVCITDDWQGLDSGIRVIELWKDLGTLQSPHGDMHPSCYRRLRAFDSSMRDIIGPRFVSVDLDCVITGDMQPVWDRPEDFVIWGAQLRATPYNGSMWMMDAGARERVWTQFAADSPQRAARAGFAGSDQAWISFVLGPYEYRWGTKDGVYGFRTDVRRHGYKLPDGARIVFFQGALDPWSPQSLQLSPWIREHYHG